jgi:hypothetical protein
MRIKVEWNNEHSWKVVKEYKNNKISSLRFLGDKYVPVKDYSGRGYDCGNCYIASDVCDKCDLQKYCRTNNPIQRACEEYDETEIKWISI